jgi:hypothetical protein
VGRKPPRPAPARRPHPAGRPHRRRHAELALADDGLFHWLFLACAVAGGGFGIYTTLLVLTGRDAL